ncbi:BatD family protein [Gilvimarinus agarilyticus]|uniref:BatD family protein n=1 Tax=Gilvimarinus agarilyticus TaxID=679259 RepID=UPI00059FB89E|nr:BatD family protein [Gilvimarinus agarilyticus]
MSKVILAWALCCISVATLAEPKITSSVSNEQVMVGQINTVSVKVLVPTWFTKAVYFDEVEAVNIISLATNKSSYPISENVDGKTWSGIVKDYTVVPMTEGSYTLDFPPLTLHFGGEGGSAETVDITPPPVTFSAYIPPAAQNLDPLIIADSIDLQQSFEAPDQLTVGDSISRALTARVSGSSSLFLPSLLQKLESEAVASYQQSPVSKDEVSGGQVSGVRTERQDALTQAPGEIVFDDISVRYYQPSSGEVIEVVAEGKAFQVAKPAATSLQKLFYALVALLGVLVCTFIARWLRVKYKAYQQTEPVLFRRTLQSLKKPNRASEQLLHTWNGKWPQAYRQNFARQQEFTGIVFALEQDVYLSRETANLPSLLRDYRRALQQMVNTKHSQLQPLNP